MKHALPREINSDLALYRPRGNSDPRRVVRDSTRIQGGNWNMQGIRRSGHVHDEEEECQMSIAEFMRGQERTENLE